MEKASSGPGGLKKKEISNFKTKNRKVIKCPSCDFKCSNLNELGKLITLRLAHPKLLIGIHMRNETHHHPCTHEGCTKSFRSKVKLQNHMSTEHDGTNCGAFLCDQVTKHLFSRKKTKFPYFPHAYCNIQGNIQP